MSQGRDGARLWRRDESKGVSESTSPQIKHRRCSSDNDIHRETQMLHGPLLPREKIAFQIFWVSFIPKQ